jgi:hypothetical protein
MAPLDNGPSDDVERARWGDVFECDACDYEVSGCTAQDLIVDGWRWQPIPHRSHEYFVMCDGCVAEYARRRERVSREAADAA